MGKGGGKGCSPQIIGYGYSLSFVYALCTKADFVSGWKLNDKISWNDKNSLVNSDDSDTYKVSVTTKTLQTGIKGKPKSSIDNGEFKSSATKSFKLKNPITFAMRDYGSYQYPNNDVGDYDGIRLSNLCFFKTADKGAFVGDNVASVPRYSARLSRFWLSSKPGDENYCKIGDCSVNPIDVLIEMMTKYGGIPFSQIDTNSFDEAREICKNEGFGVSFLLTSEQKLTEWIKKLLKIIDGILYFNTLTGKWVVRLFRPNIDDSNASYFTITEENSSKLSIEGGSWDNIYSTIILKYTNSLTGKTESKKFENTAVKRLLGYEKILTEDYKLIGEENVINKLGQRLLNKYAKPLATLKARISIFDLHNVELGDIIKLSSNALSIPEKLFRIVEIGADKEEDTYIDIKAVEELWTKEVKNTLTITSGARNSQKSEDIEDLKPAYVRIFDLPSFFYVGDNETSLAVFVSYPANGKEKDYLITEANFNVDSSRFSATLCNFAKLSGDSDEVVIPKDTNYKLNTFEFNVEPTDKGYDLIKEVSLSESDWTSTQYLLLIDNEMFAYKKLNKIGDPDSHKYQITGLLRLGRYQYEHKGGSLCLIFKVSEVSNIVAYKVLPDKNKTYSGFLSNTDFDSESLSSNKTFSDTGLKPLEAGNPYVFVDTDNNLILKFRECVRGEKSNCIYKSIDDISAGEKERNTEITHIIIKYADTSTTIDVDDLDFHRGTYKGNLTDINSDITKDNIKSIAVKIDNLTSEYIDIYLADKELY